MAHILIIEPDKLLARTYADACIHAGYTVDVTHNGQDAIQAADASTPDAVLLELQLAGQDGIAFLHEFHSYSEWWDVPVIVQTTVTLAAIEPLLSVLRAELGVTAYLYKTSTTLQQLQRTLRETLAVRNRA